MSHNNLKNYYSTIFALTFHHKYSISELEDLYPYELEVYTALLSQYLDKLNKANNQ